MSGAHKFPNNHIHHDVKNKSDAVLKDKFYVGRHLNIELKESTILTLHKT